MWRWTASATTAEGEHLTIWLDEWSAAVLTAYMLADIHGRARVAGVIKP